MKRLARAYTALLFPRLTCHTLQPGARTNSQKYLWITNGVGAASGLKIKRFKSVAARYLRGSFASDLFRDNLTHPGPDVPVINSFEYILAELFTSKKLAITSIDIDLIFFYIRNAVRINYERRNQCINLRYVFYVTILEICFWK